MRHIKSGRKLNRTKAHRKALMINLATALFQHKRINTTEAKAKELRVYAEAIITRAKKAYIKEQAGDVPEGHTYDMHSRRVVARFIKDKAVLQELFEVIAPKVVDRPGGYTRVIKTDYRRGDGGKKAMIELVDWAPEQDGPTTINQAKKIERQKRRDALNTKSVDNAVVEEEVKTEVADTVVEETIAEVKEIVAPSETENTEKKESTKE